MSRNLTFACALALMGGAALFAAEPRNSAARFRASNRSAIDQPQQRTIFVTPSSKTPPSGLKIGDFFVREDNSDRTVTDVHPATERIKLAILMDERGLWSPSVRQGLIDFANAMDGKADIGLFSVIRPELKAIDFAPSARAFIDRLQEIGPVSNQMRTEYEWYPHIEDLARTFQSQHVARPIIVAIDQTPVSRVALPPTWDVIVKEIQQSHTTVFAVGFKFIRGILDSAIEASGGSGETVVMDTGAPAALERIAKQILSQYAVTYDSTPPPGDGFRLRVSAGRPAATAKAPTRVY